MAGLGPVDAHLKGKESFQELLGSGGAEGALMCAYEMGKLSRETHSGSS